jgi:hypothetical protein
MAVGTSCDGEGYRDKGEQNIAEKTQVLAALSIIGNGQYYW